MRIGLVFLYILCFIYGCKQGVEKETELYEDADFIHPFVAGPRPWTHEAFDNDKFTFAIFSDLSGGERDGIFEVAIDQLNLLRPDLIINVGDLIEGDHENSEELSEQWDSFDERADRARAPIFYVGGNHDLTTEQMREVWLERYGRSYYHFVYKDVLFLVLDTEDYTPQRSREIAAIRKEALDLVEEKGWEVFPETEYANIPERIGGRIGNEQAEYFQKAISENGDVLHTFIFVHKAPWKINDENFLALEKALQDRAYTLFNGHVHAYEYEERNGHDYIRLATTGGVQFPELGRSADHITLVTVDQNGVDIANLLMAGILDKKGNIPNGGDTLCFEKALCVD